MFQIKSLSELNGILSDLINHLIRFDETLGRDAPSSYSSIPPNDLNFILSSSDVELLDKKKIVLHETGRIRINLYSAYNYKIDQYKKNEQYWEAIKLKDQYINSVAIPFIGKIDGPSIIDRVKDFFNINRILSPREYIQKWQAHYSSWPEIDWNSPLNKYKKASDEENSKEEEK